MASLLLWAKGMPSSFLSPLTRWFASLGLCVCALAGGGCSYLFVDGPPKQHRQLPYFTCTTSKAWPVVDTVLGSLYGVEAIALLSVSSSKQGSESGLAGAGAVAGGLAALFIASAVSGYHDASECREATEALQMRLMRMMPSPGNSPTPYAPGPNYDPWLHPTNRSFGAPPSTPPPPASEGAPVPAPETPKDER
jgi:hypothetical protein